MRAEIPACYQSMNVQQCQRDRPTFSVEYVSFARKLLKLQVHMGCYVCTCVGRAECFVIYWQVLCGRLQHCISFIFMPSLTE